MKAKYILTIALALGALMTGRGLAAMTETDERIAVSFKKTYVYQEYLKDDAIRLACTNGYVTLTGTVAFDSHKALAGETAAGLPGVKNVDNQLISKAERAAEHSDAWILNDVKVALLFHHQVSASKTQVEVKDAVVTLKGVAENEAQKELTAEYAKDVEGVKDVRNEMTVEAPAPSATQRMAQGVDDASVTAQVKVSLMSHRSTSIRRTKVSTQNGVVTVSCTAMNDAEKALVTKLATDITGVKEVINTMTGEQPRGK